MFIKRFLFSSILSLSVFVATQASDVQPEDTVPPQDQAAVVFEIEKDDPIVAMLDSLALLTVFRNIEKNTPQPEYETVFPAGFVPEYSDSVYNVRFQQLNANSTIEFVYNPYVKTYIGLYANRRRDLTERVLGLGQLYFPLFEEQLDKYNLPLELKYLAIIESALNPLARSRVGATGLWQFMYGTGKMYGLQVNTMIDDRSDIYKSTVAACEHFVDLYAIYKDWNLVLAAYNAGPGNVNRAIRRAGGVKDFWRVRNYLPRETRNYVPAFMAVTYVMEHARDHNLFPNPPVYSHFDVDTIQIKKQVSLSTIEEFLDIPIDHLRYLNPTFKQNIIPFNQKKPYVLRLPRDYTALFVNNEDTIYNHRTPEQLRQEELAARMQETTVHVVRSGEVLGSIARRYGTSVREIQSLNNLRGTMIRTGQRLIVRAPARPAVHLASNTNTHVVKRGETLGVIAARYGITLDEIKHWNSINTTIIHPGQNLVVRKPEGMQPSPEQAEATEDDTTGNDEEEYFFYTVQQGDTLNDIIEKYEHVSLEELTELNGLSSGSTLTPGQRIKIFVQNDVEE